MLRRDAVDAMASVVAYIRQESDCHLDPAHTEATAERFVRMMEELTQGDKGWEMTTFQSNRDEMVIVKDIAFVSVCAHHLAPFMGVAHVAYIPGPAGEILGLSKLARVVHLFAKALQVQEELTGQIAEAVEMSVGALGVGVVVEAEHTCMTIRGVQAAGSKTVTSCMKGVFLDPNKGARTEFLTLIKA